VALLSRVSALLALVSRQAAAKELSAESAADRAVQASADVAATRSTERAAQAGVDPASDASASVDAAKQSVTEQGAHLTEVTGQVNQGNAFEVIRAADARGVATDGQLESATEAYRVGRCAVREPASHDEQPTPRPTAGANARRPAHGVLPAMYAIWAEARADRRTSGHTSVRTQ
jgi:hypothetical protein